MATVYAITVIWSFEAVRSTQHAGAVNVVTALNFLTYIFTCIREWFASIYYGHK